MGRMTRQQRRALQARRAERRAEKRLTLSSATRTKRRGSTRSSPEKVAAIELRARQDIERALAEITRQAASEERRVLSTPLVSTRARVMDDPRRGCGTARHPCRLRSLSELESTAATVARCSYCAPVEE